VAYIPHTVRKPLSRIIDKLSLVCLAVRNEGNIAVFMSFILYRCVPDHLLFYVDKLKVFPYSSWSWKLVRDWGKCRWCVESSVTIFDTVGINSVIVYFQSGFYSLTFAKPEGKWPHGRHKLRREINNIVNLQVVGREGLDWIELAPERDI